VAHAPYHPEGSSLPKSLIGWAIEFLLCPGQMDSTSYTVVEYNFVVLMFIHQGAQMF